MHICLTKPTWMLCYFKIPLIHIHTWNIVKLRQRTYTGYQMIIPFVLYCIYIKIYQTRRRFLKLQVSLSQCSKWWTSRMHQYLIIPSFNLYYISIKAKMEIHLITDKLHCLLYDSICFVFREIPSIKLYVVWPAGEIPKYHRKCQVFPPPPPPPPPVFSMTILLLSIFKMSCIIIHHKWQSLFPKASELCRFDMTFENTIKL